MNTFTKENLAANKDILTTQWDEIHTVILEYFNIKEYALSNFAFQSF